MMVYFVEGMSWQEVAKAASKAAEDKGEWAGAPVPIDSYPLCIAPRYGLQGLNGMRSDGHRSDTEDAPDSDAVFVNQWWCPSRGGYLAIYRVAGETVWFLDRDYAERSSRSITRAFAAFEASFVQDSAAETMAQEKLASMIAPHLMNCYRLHGMILETSPRSGVTYILRKGRPTLALRQGRDGNMRILCALCLHPIGYYESTFVGCMVPTDEVISHLVLIRADEHTFWRRANQHPAWSWEAGL